MILLRGVGRDTTRNYGVLLTAGLGYATVTTAVAQVIHSGALGGSPAIYYTPSRRAKKPAEVSSISIISSVTLIDDEHGSRIGFGEALVIEPAARVPVLRPITELPIVVKAKKEVVGHQTSFLRRGRQIRELELVIVEAWRDLQ